MSSLVWEIKRKCWTKRQSHGGEKKISWVFQVSLSKEGWRVHWVSEESAETYWAIKISGEKTRIRNENKKRRSIIGWKKIEEKITKR